MSDFRKRMLEEDHERALLAKASIDELRRKMVYRTEDVTRSDIYTAILELDERLRKVEATRPQSQMDQEAAHWAHCGDPDCKRCEAYMEKRHKLRQPRPKDEMQADIDAMPWHEKSARKVAEHATRQAKEYLKLNGNLDSFFTSWGTLDCIIRHELLHECQAVGIPDVRLSTSEFIVNPCLTPMKTSDTYIVRYPAAPGSIKNDKFLDTARIHASFNPEHATRFPKPIADKAAACFRDLAGDGWGMAVVELDSTETPQQLFKT